MATLRTDAPPDHSPPFGETLREILREALQPTPTVGGDLDSIAPVIEEARTTLLQAAATRDLEAARRAADATKIRLLEAFSASPQPDRDGFTLLMALALLTKDRALAEQFVPLLGARPVVAASNGARRTGFGEAVPDWVSSTALRAWHALGSLDDREAATPPCSESGPNCLAAHHADGISAPQLPPSAAYRAHSLALGSAFAGFLGTTFLTAGVAVLPLVLDGNLLDDRPSRGVYELAAGALLVVSLIAAEALTRRLAEPVST